MNYPLKWMQFFFFGFKKTVMRLETLGTIDGTESENKNYSEHYSVRPSQCTAFAAEQIGT